MIYRLRAEYESLQKTDREQSEKMEQLSLKAYVLFALSLIQLIFFSILELEEILFCFVFIHYFLSIYFSSNIFQMFIRISLLLFSLITRIHCQNSIDTSRYFLIVALHKRFVLAVQSTCFNDISIFKSNSPHVIQKKGDGICVAHEGGLSRLICFCIY